METKTIRSGAPYVLCGLGVLAYALVFGIGSLLSYVLAAAVGVLSYRAGSRLFPDRVIEVERAPRSGDKQADALIAEARAQLAEIAAADEAIADPALSAQIQDIIATCRMILARLEEQPGMLSSLRTFLRYYLPATMKLLHTRAELEHEVNAGAAAQIAAKISAAVSRVQAAFHKQLDALQEFRFISLESEMDVLSDMLRSDGLTEDAAEKQHAEDTPAAGAQDDPFAGLFAQGDQ